MTIQDTRNSHHISSASINISECKLWMDPISASARWDLLYDYDGVCMYIPQSWEHLDSREREATGRKWERMSGGTGELKRFKAWNGAGKGVELWLRLCKNKPLCSSAVAPCFKCKLLPKAVWLLSHFIEISHSNFLCFFFLCVNLQ